MKTQLTEEQDAAIQAYAEHYGKGWKKQLLDDWLTGKDASRPNGHLLRQVRNQFGPQWLEEYR